MQNAGQRPETLSYAFSPAPPGTTDRGVDQGLTAQPVTTSSLTPFDGFVWRCGSNRAFAASAGGARCSRCGSASDKHSSITPSNVFGRKGLRRQRVAPSLRAIFRKSALDGSRSENTYPE